MDDATVLTVFLAKADAVGVNADAAMQELLSEYRGVAYFAYEDPDQKTKKHLYVIQNGQPRIVTADQSIGAYGMPEANWQLWRLKEAAAEVMGKKRNKPEMQPREAESELAVKRSAEKVPPTTPKSTAASPKVTVLSQEAGPSQAAPIVDVTGASQEAGAEVKGHTAAKQQRKGKGKAVE